jgi:predicted membrane protein
MKNDIRLSPSKLGKLIIGGLLVSIGTLFLLKQFGFLFPVWLFSWPMILIVIGLFSGAKHQYRYDKGWLIITGIGVFFLLRRIYPDTAVFQYLWPVAIIGAGLWVLLSSNQLWKSDKTYSKPWYTNTETDTNTAGVYSNDVMDDVVIFGASNKQVLSKNFKGGEVVNIFGGIQLNFLNADIVDGAEIEIVQIFGGVKLIVPSNWDIVIAEVVTVFGGIDDKRRQPNPMYDKRLIIKGVAIFGGIEIHTYA